MQPVSPNLNTLSKFFMTFLRYLLQLLFTTWKLCLLVLFFIWSVTSSLRRGKQSSKECPPLATSADGNPPQQYSIIKDSDIPSMYHTPYSQISVRPPSSKIVKVKQDTRVKQPYD